MNFKPIAATALFTLVTAFAGAARAETIDFVGCTKDHRTATLKVDVQGSFKNGDTLKKVTESIFKKDVAAMNGNEFLGSKGAKTFVGHIIKALAHREQQTEDSSFIIRSEPVLGSSDSCKP